MALIIEAPNEVNSLDNQTNYKIFLAGGITACSDWQSYVISEFRNIPYLTIFNPRRKKFDINNKNSREEQIVWEFKHLIESDIIVFWFAKGSLNPVALYELGMHGNSSEKLIVIGIDPGYERKEDVIIQTTLARPEVPVFHSMEEMVASLHELFNYIEEE